ncbi:MAG: hypothetical protein PHY92_03620 [Alphaproteobacteria bacterium]|nr:hypothetical protein [Alphaproteobacteria bacterium]
MKLDIQAIGKSFAPGVMVRAIRAFDRATIVVVLTCWAGALLIMTFALYTLNLSVTAKREMAAAAAGEPALPRIVAKGPETAEIQPLVDRLKKQFPAITLNLGRDQTLTVSTMDVGNFRLWLTVLGYIDTALPQYRWTMNEFCVGSKCDRTMPMMAILKPEKISFATGGKEKK